MDNNKKRNQPARNEKTNRNGKSGGVPMRKYYGPTGTPDYPYHSPELDEPTVKEKRFPVLRRIGKFPRREIFSECGIDRRFAPGIGTRNQR